MKPQTYVREQSEHGKKNAAKLLARLNLKVHAKRAEEEKAKQQGA